MSKREFKTLKTEPGRLPDYTHKVIVYDSIKCIGQGSHRADVMLQDGNIVERAYFEVRKNKKENEEYVFFEDPIGGHQGRIDDITLSRLRFCINFASD